MKITNKDIIWGYLGTIFNLATNIILLPFVYIFLTGDELGIWYIFMSIGSIVNLLDFGFTPTLNRNIAYTWSGANQLKKERAEFVNSETGPNIFLFKTVLISSKYIYLLISTLALLLLFTLGTRYILYLGLNFKGNYLMISWCIFVIAIFVNLYMSYFGSFLKGVGAISQYNKALVISKSCQIIISIILLLLDFGLLAVALAYLITGFVYRFLCKMYFFKYENIGDLLKENIISIKLSEVKKYFLIIWHNAWRDGLVSVSNFLATQASTILCSLFLSLTQTGIYSLSLQIVTVIQNVSSSLYTVYQPLMQEAFIRNDREKPKRLMATAITVYSTFFLIGSILISTFGVYLLEIFKPNSHINKFYLISMCLYIFLLQHHQLNASYISNTNRIPYVKAFIISSLITVISEFILLKYTNLNEWSLLLGPLLVQLSYNNWKWPLFVMKELNTNIYEMVKIGFQQVFIMIKHFNKVWLG